LQPYKGQSYLIEACALLRERGLDFRCRIIGGGELTESLTAQIAAAGLEGQVTLTGPQPQQAVAKMLSEADCYVQPSLITQTGKMEGIPVALMEAMACGLPVVATQISGIPELVRPAETGWLVPQKNAAALADAILEVANQPEESRKRAAAGRELVYQEFDLQKNSARLLALFTDAK
jgi:colanic acid/amylovoran biosynthesis glycosyltransferase